MPNIDIGDLIKRERMVTMDYDGETVELRYRPHAYDGETHYRIMTGDAARLEDETDVLCKLLVGWNLTQHSKPLPIEEKTLGRLPYVFLRDMGRTIATDIIGGAGKDAGPNDERPS